MRTIRAARSVAVRGRPGARFPLPSYFSAMSLRCHLSKRIGRDNGRNVSEHPPSQRFDRDCQAAPLIVVEPQWPGAELYAEDPILLAKIFDDLLLLMIHPASHGDQQQPQRIQGSGHQPQLSIRAGMQN